MKTIPQGTLLWPKEPITIGRISAHAGQSFWITNSTTDQKRTNQISIARSGKSMAYAVRISPDQAEAFFNIQ